MVAALLALALSASPAPPVASPPQDGRLTVLAAMREELDRSMARLRLDGYEAPYFLSYQVKDVTKVQVAGRFGAVFEDQERRDRNLYVDLRVGSYELDSSSGEENTLVFGGEAPTWFVPKDAPLDGDAAALRGALWLATDERYKEALSSWFKKKSRGVYRQDPADLAPSMSREAAARHVDPPRGFPFDRERWSATVREVTTLFRAHPEVFEGALRVDAERQVRWFTSSEGSELLTEQTIYGAHLLALTRAPDGQLLEAGRDYYVRTEADLPSPAQLREDAAKVVAELLALRAAPVIDPYTGPAILEAEATGVLLHEAVGHRLEGERVDDDKEGQTYKGQVGRGVLPPFLTIVDDPSLERAAGVPLNGSYRFDEQGVPGQRTVLVREGKLEAYLLSRKPVRPFERSNGHGRSQGSRAPMARMSNLLVESRKRVGATELKRLLMAEARRQGKPYGLVIRDITGGNTNTMSFGYQAFKGTPRLVYRVDARTGAEQLVRGVELVGTPLASINKIVATGDTPRAFNGYCGAESGYVPVSTVAPAALVGEIELQRVTRASDRAPLLPPPWPAPSAGAPAAAPPQGAAP